MIRSASLAACLPPPGGAGAVAAWSADAGVRAAVRGAALPLPLLLDVRSLWVGRGPTWLLLRPLASQSEESRAYEEWLVRFCDQCRMWFRIRPGRASSADGWDLLPALISAWPSDATVSIAFRSLYASLAEPQNMDRVVRAWCGPRESAVPQLRRWFAAITGDPEPTLAGGLWSCHSTVGETAWLDATFDHEAARMYVGAQDPEITPEQQRRITRLRLRRRSLEFSRIPVSYEEPNPFSGAWMLATLVLGELGDHMIVNGTDIRISSNPPALPPRDMDVHLHWALGTAGLTRKHEAPDFGDGLEPGVQPADASVLQGFAALLFDDWRSALRNLPLRFHAHFGEPDAAADSFGRGGKRWKPSASGVGPMPPQPAVVRFFRRCDWATLPQRGLRWRQKLGGWGCLLVLRCDLDEFGFKEGRHEQSPGRTIWRAETTVLSTSISLVIVLDSPAGDAVLCRVLHSHSELFLAPVRGRALVESQPDTSFLDVRKSALDLLLDALEQVMR